MCGLYVRCWVCANLTQFNVISFGSAAGIFQLLPRIPVFKICVSRMCVGVHLVFGNSDSWNEFHFRVKVAGTQICKQWEVYKKMCFQCIGEGHTKCWFPLDQQLCVSQSYPASQVHECNQVRDKNNKLNEHSLCSRSDDQITRGPHRPLLFLFDTDIDVLSQCRFDVHDEIADTPVEEFVQGAI